MTHASVALHPDRWLSDVLARPTYSLHMPSDVSDEASVSEALAAIPESAFFVYAKVPTGQYLSSALLERQGFSTVETSLTFDKLVARPPSGLDHRGSTDVVTAGGDPVTVRFARPEDRPGAVSVAARSFTHSRFHVDPAIGQGMADRLKAQWAENFFHGVRGDAMAIAEAGGDIIGFLQLLRTGRDLVVDLIAVDPRWHGKAVGQRMIVWAERQFDAVEVVVVTTQASNIPSVRLWEKLGFRLSRSVNVLHLHRDASDRGVAASPRPAG